MQVSSMEPLKLKPTYKSCLWGGEKLRTKYGKETDIMPLAESWELSCHPDGKSVIVGGTYDGTTLDDYIKANKGCLGTSCVGEELPILIKLIDARDDLSVQVHPDDVMARELEGQNGKTEMWYVLEADYDAKITCGMKRTISKDELRKAIADNMVCDVLNTVFSKKGDIFFVEAGTVHAIGKGNVIAEIQQNSNVTYRLYDYDRADANGNRRELHIEKAVQAAKCEAEEVRQFPTVSDGVRVLGSCDYFEVKEITVSNTKTLCADETSYHVVLVAEGSVELADTHVTTTLKMGETAFLPAGLGEYTLSGNATVLLTHSRY